MRIKNTFSFIGYVVLPIVFVYVITESTLAVLALILCYLGFSFFGKKEVKQEQVQLPKLSDERAASYAANGLSTNDINLFRKTMQQAKEEIKTFDDLCQENAQLKSIDLKYQTLMQAKEYFKTLVKQPQRLAQANQFLYVYLPKLVNLSQKYHELSKNPPMNQTQHEQLHETLEVIEALASAIAKDYDSFVTADLTSLANDVKITKQLLKQHATTEGEV